MRDHITIVGNVGADPELRRLPDGTTVASLRVASQDRHIDAKTGTWVDGVTSWYDVSAFRGLGENVLASISRGQRVIVSGALTIRRWENGDRSGTAAEIVASAIGHELKFGTTTFTGSGGAPVDPQSRRPQTAEPEPADGAASDWSSDRADAPF